MTFRLLWLDVTTLYGGNLPKYTGNGTLKKSKHVENGGHVSACLRCHSERIFFLGGGGLDDFDILLTKLLWIGQKNK